jgi:hypothetical protein
MTSKILFWEKWALQPDDTEEDQMYRFEIKDDPKIRQVLREFESKTIIKRIDFDDVHPENSSVKKWINSILNSNDDINEDIIEDLINTFRFSLYPRSKKKLDNIVGVLLLHDTMILLHTKKFDTLVESEERVFPAEVILSAKNVLRAAIIKDEDGKKTFSAFEYNRKMSKGHANFWQIPLDNVSWESIGTLSLYIDIDGFDLPITLPIESEQIDEMINNHNLSPTGKIRLGRIEGKITKVKVLRNEMGYNDFYDFHILKKEELDKHQKQFSKIISSDATQSILYSTFKPDYYEYSEDFAKLIKYTPSNEEIVIRKEHPRYSICYFTHSYPRVRPNPTIVTDMYHSIFNNHRLDLWHAGEHISEEPYILGNLRVYNELNIIHGALEFGNNLLNISQDLHSRKEKLILQYLLCEYWKKFSSCKHFPVIFDHINQTIIQKDIEFEFNFEAISATEQYLEYKSASQCSPKINRFVGDTLVPTIHSYIHEGNLSRYGIIYGVEDNGAISPIYHFKNDMVTDIQKKANELLINDGITIKAIPIPFKEEMILLVLLIPSAN